MSIKTISLSRSVVTTFLAFLYVLGYIITPYWAVAATATVQILLLAFTVAGGIVWIWLSTRGFDFRIIPFDWVIFVLILLGLIAINQGTLTSVIGWRGDEDFHIRNTLELVKQISGARIFMLFFPLTLFLYLSWHKPNWAIPINLSLTACGIIFLYLTNPLKDFDPTLLLRYPFINYYIFAIAPKLATFISNPYHEFLYRIVPLLSIAASIFLLLRRLANADAVVLLLWGIAIATTPVVFYYSSILYLEPLAISLMTVVCFRIKTLIESDPEELKRDPGWHALILIGFIKETTLIFLGCFILLRIAILLRRRIANSQIGRLDAHVFHIRHESRLEDQMRGELGIAFSILFPALAYLFFRNTLIDTRTFTPHIINLADSSLYGVVIHSFVEQFGIFWFLFTGGIILLFGRKDYTTASFLILIVIAYPVVHILDHKEYTGYSRFNLFVLPPLLAGSFTIISEMLKKKKFFGILVSIVIIVFNLQNSPIQRDGTKKPNWGNYLLNVSEHYYPYNEAFSWISETYRREQMLIAGFNYPYFFDFYFQKFDWKPNYRKMISNDAPSEEDTLSRAIDRAGQTGCTVILFHVLGQTPPSLDDMHGFHRVKVFKNMSHLLVVYHLRP